MKACCFFSLESPRRSDSNDYTQYTIFNIKENLSLLSKICSYGILSKGLKNEFETAVVNEPSVFEPLKVYCRYTLRSSKFDIITVASLLSLCTCCGGATFNLRDNYKRSKLFLLQVDFFKRVLSSKKEKSVFFL